MSDDYTRESDEQKSRKYGASYETALDPEGGWGEARPGAQGYSIALLGDEKTESRGNEAVRTSFMQSAQKTHGNRAVQRFIQRMAAGSAMETEDDELARQIESKSGGGSQLDHSVRGKLEQGLGADLSGVRVHTDPEADKLARSVDSIAFTSGQDIFFRSGHFNPESSEGLKLLAHEATHTVQQSQGPVDGTESEGGVSISDPSDKFEQAAEKAAEAVTGSLPAVQSQGHESSPLQRLYEEETMPMQRMAVQRVAVQRFSFSDLLPDWGSRPPQAGEAPRGYAYGGVNDAGGVSGGVSAFSGSGNIGPVPASVDWLTANGSAGAWGDGSGGTRYGITGNAAVNRWSLGNTGQGSPVQFDAGVGTANAEASLGSNGATLGVGANAVEGAVTVGNFNRNSDIDEQARFGLSYGVGAAGRLHWGDSDHDGHREYGLGADIGPVSFDIKTEDPLRTGARLGLGMMPGIGPLAAMGFNAIAPDYNMTDAAGSALSSAYDTTSDYASRGYNAVSNAASGAYDTASDYANRGYNAVSNAASGAYDTASNAASSAWDWVSSNVDPSSLTM